VEFARVADELMGLRQAHPLRRTARHLILCRMAAQSRLGRQVQEIGAALDIAGVPFALIGGLALAAHNVVRATSDVDLLAPAGNAADVDAVATKLGYHCLHRSADTANYLRGDERLDLLFASRPLAQRLLRQARERVTILGALRVVSAEGLIGLKLQALTNDPRRTQDLEDIRSLLRAHRGALDQEELREYFRLFDRESLLDELLHEQE
jgi:predicted nucleotidyltransferase